MGRKITVEDVGRWKTASLETAKALRSRDFNPKVFEQWYSILKKE